MVRAYLFSHPDTGPTALAFSADEKNLLADILPWATITPLTDQGAIESFLLALPAQESPVAFTVSALVRLMQTEEHTAGRAITISSLGITIPPSHP